MKHHHLRLFLPFFLFTFTFSLINAQTWEPVGGGLTGGDTNVKGVVYTMCVYNNKLYVGGRFTQAGKLKVNHIASWDGAKWDSLSCGTDKSVQALGVYKNLLCVGGDFTMAGRKHARSIALWVDTINTKPEWFNIGKGIMRPGYYTEKEEQTVIAGISEYNGFLYIRGYFHEAGNVSVHGLVRWNGNKGWEYPDKILADPEFAGPLFVFNNKLYLGGDTRAPLYEQEGKNMLWTWDDNVFTNETIKNGPATIESILAIDSSIYVGGPAGTGQYSILKWDGKKWSPLGDLPRWRQVNSIVQYNNKIYIGGQCWDADANVINCIACWDGNSWQSVGTNFSTTVKWHKACVQSLCVYKGELYAAGYFTNSGGKTVMNIAKLK